jgi:predicted PurR-regulated permease PerM
MSAESPSPRFLTPGQQKLVGFALGLFSLVGILTVITLGIMLLARLVGHFSNVLWPLAVAGIAALILRPVVDLLQRRLRLRRPAAVTLLYGVVVLAFGALLFAIVPALFTQLVDFLTYLPSLWERAYLELQAQYPSWIAFAQGHLEHPAVRETVDALVARGRDLLGGLIPSLWAAGGGIWHLLAFVTSAAIVPIYLFFFLLSTREPTSNLPRHFAFLPPGWRDDAVFLVREFIGIVVAFFRGQLLIGLIMGVMLAVGFSIAGLRFGLFIGLALGILNIVPYLGTIVGLSVALPLAFFQPEGGLLLLVWVLVIFTVVQLIESWFLTPRIMGRSTGLHPVTIIVAIFFWGTALGGILGMILAVPLTAFFVTAWRLAQRKYFNPA